MKSGLRFIVLVFWLRARSAFARLSKDYALYLVICIYRCISVLHDETWYNFGSFFLLSERKSGSLTDTFLLFTRLISQCLVIFSFVTSHDISAIFRAHLGSLGEHDKIDASLTKTRHLRLRDHTWLVRTLDSTCDLISFYMQRKFRCTFHVHRIIQRFCDSFFFK